MANEITVRSGLTVKKNNVNYNASPSGFTTSMSGEGGPYIGTINVTEDGVDLDLSVIDTPGICRIQNLDTTAYLQVGTWNPDQSEFYPLLRFKPGESFVFRLDPDINEEYEGTGTGTSGQLNTTRLKSSSGTIKALVEVFPD